MSQTNNHANIQLDILKNSNGQIDTESIKKIIPYDKPFLFIDKVVSLSSNKIIAIKELSGKEDFLKGHFVGFPIMPGALTVEGMGQAATLLARCSIPNHQEKDVLAYKLKEVKFMLPILPPAHIRFEVEMIAQDERGAILKGKAFVRQGQDKDLAKDDKEELAAEALLMLAIVDKNEFRAKYSK